LREASFRALFFFGVCFRKSECSGYIFIRNDFRLHFRSDLLFELFERLPRLLKGEGYPQIIQEAYRRCTPLIIFRPALLRSDAPPILHPPHFLNKTQGKQENTRRIPQKAGKHVWHQTYQKNQRSRLAKPSFIFSNIAIAPVLYFLIFPNSYSITLKGFNGPVKGLDPVDMLKQFRAIQPPPASPRSSSFASGSPRGQGILGSQGHHPACKVSKLPGW